MADKRRPPTPVGSRRPRAALGGAERRLDRRRRRARRRARARGRRPRPRRRRRSRRRGARRSPPSSASTPSSSRPSSGPGASSRRARGWQVDVTALRGETIEADLAERDFTIGAVAVPLAGGEPIDPYGGLADLERGVLRAVGEEQLRRATRCGCCAPPRLAAELGLEIDPRTVALARAAAARAAEPAGERQLAELRQLLGGPDPLRGLALLDELGLTRRRPARAGGAARRRAGPEPPPRRLRPHARRARAHARGRGATSSASPASAPPRSRRCSTSRSPTR